MPSTSRADGTTGIVVVCDLMAHADAMAQALGRAGLWTILGAADDQVTAVLHALDAPARVTDLVIVFDAFGRLAINAARVYTRRVPGVHLIALGVTEPEFEALARAGARTHVPPWGTLDDVVEAIHAVTANGAQGGRDDIVARTLSRERRFDRGDDWLTDRELEIVALIADGLTNHEIGERLHIELPTVKNHIHNVFAKLGIRRRAQAAAWFRSRFVR